MSDKSPSDKSKSGDSQSADSKSARDPSEPLADSSKPPEESGAAARAARRLRRVAPSSGESRLSRISRARQSAKGPIKHPRDLLGVSLADGRYIVKAPLGKGSMAYVFRASDARLQTDVVLKVPKPEKVNTADFRERFQRESQLLIRFSHPHVVKVLDVGEYSELPYVVMQLLEGGSLSDRIAREADETGRMTPESLKTWVREVARALDFCFRRGMVHRDVKPANILFDEDNNAYVSDFGLSKIMCGEHTELSSDETAAGIVLGTPNYISPEVVQGKDYDGRSDQYSLGITLYHVLTGGPPMQGNTATMTMLNQTQKVLPLLSDLRPDVPRPLAVAVRKAIEKDPGKRFNTCVEFAEAVIEGLRFVPAISASSNSSASKRLPDSRNPAPLATGSAASSAASTSKTNRSAGHTRPQDPLASRSGRKNRKSSGGSEPSSESSSSRKRRKSRKAASGSSSRSSQRPSSQRRSSSASSSLAIDADMDWFDMDTSGEYSSARSSSRSSSHSRSSSKSSGRRRVRNAKPSNGKLINVFGQQLHPIVLGGLALFSVFSVAMVVWSPWAPTEASPALMAGQYHPAASNSEQKSQKQQPNSKSGGQQKGRNAAGKKNQNKTAKSEPASSSKKKKSSNATTASSGPKAPGLAGSPLAGSKSSAAAKPDQNNAVPETTEQVAAVEDAGSENLNVVIHQDAEPVFDVPEGVTLFGHGRADVFVSGRAVRSRATAKEKAVLSASYSPEGFTAISDDGKWFAATVTDRADRDFLVRVWETATGKLQMEIGGDGRRRVRNLFLSGQYLYLETDRATQLQVWNLKRKRQQGQLPLPANRIRRQRMALTSDGSAFAAIVGGEVAIIDGRTGAVTSSLKAPSPPAVQVAMADSSIKLQALDSQEMLQSTRLLKFSDDRQQLAGVRTVPQPTLMVWDNLGRLQDDLPVGVAAQACQPDAIQWFTERRAWLVNGSVVDGKHGRVVVCVPHDDEQVATIGLQDDNHLLTTVRSDVGHIYRRQIPWQHINASLQSMTNDETALLKPRASVQVSVEVSDGNGAGVVLRPLLERAIEEKLRTQQISVSDKAPLKFRVRPRKVTHQPDVVTVLELLRNEDDRVIWYAVVGPPLQMESDDFAAQRSLVEGVGHRISTLAIPYYVPSDASQIMLPYCIDE